MVDGEQRQEQYAQYKTRLAQLIKDVRRDLKVEQLPVVIGELGAGGERGDFQTAQEAVANLPELENTVAFAKTCEFWDAEVAEMSEQGVWKGPEWVKFYNVGSNRAYHYLGSARIYYQMGKAFGRSMLDLMPEDSLSEPSN
jgi:hypothetical protein